MTESDRPARGYSGGLSSIRRIYRDMRERLQNK